MFDLPKCLCADYRLNFGDMVVGMCPYGYERRCVDCANYKVNRYGYLHDGLLSESIDDLICHLFFLVKLRDEMMHDMDVSDL